MTKNTTGQGDDFDFDWGEEAGPDEPEITDDADDQGNEVDPDRDPNALPVTLKAGTLMVSTASSSTRTGKPFPMRQGR